MRWIKKNLHLVILFVAALLAISTSVLVTLKAMSFNRRFAPMQPRVMPEGKIEPLVFTRFDESQQELEKPATWKVNVLQRLPFVLPRYAIQDGMPIRVNSGCGHFADPLTKKLIEDKWAMDNHLSVTDPRMPILDPDHDGFSNADEWRDKTDPNDSASHPPYHTKLYLKQCIRVPFRLKFNGYDGDPKKDKAEKMTFQIDTLEHRSPSAFLKVGDNVFDGKFKVTKFEHKERENPALGSVEDVSEITLENNETKAQFVLINNRVIDSPDSYAYFTYFWPQPPIEFRVRKLGKFVLLPEKDRFYELLDVTENQATIKTPTGEIVTIERIPSGYQP